jgi:mRNA-degrading endonuclease toxin of MazEF toxin-antitoxin module
VILQDDSFAGTLPLVLVVPLTTAMAATRFPGTLLVEPTSDNGLRQPSVGLVFQLRAADRQRIRERIGSVGTEVLEAIYATLDRLMGRSPAPDE